MCILYIFSITIIRDSPFSLSLSSQKVWRVAPLSLFWKERNYRAFENVSTQLMAPQLIPEFYVALVLEILSCCLCLY